MSRGNPYEGVRIVGAGQSLYEKHSTKPVQRVMWEALDAALRSAQLPHRSVQGLALTCFTLPPDNVTTIAEHFGIEARFLFQGLYGGASGVIGMLHAARAIRDGDADVVAVLAADVFDVAAHNEMLDHFNGSVRDYLAPYGFGGANGMFALQTRAYMDAFGAVAEDFGRLPVAQRANAAGNPNALFRGAPMTMQDYLNARPIAEPLRLFDCVLPCTGGDCIILASESVASGLDVPRVRILGGGEMHNFPAEDVYALRSGWEALSPSMYQQAGLGPRDLDFAQLYDDYPVMEFLQLEGLGICERGKTPRFLSEHGTRFDQAFPINTGGGQLSAGQAGASGGMIGVVEAVLQLRGEGGARQAKCRRGVVSGYGMVAYGRGLSSSACILEREE
jgi:acetyl-CoA acetyltransferase